MNMDLFSTANKIDVGFVLSEILGDIEKHRITLDKENNKLRVSCTLKESKKEINFSLFIPKEKNDKINPESKKYQ